MNRDERLKGLAAAMRLGQSLEHILAEHGDDAIVAGGCLRDAILGKPVKDYDIFIPRWTGDLPTDAADGISSDEWKARKEKYGSLDAIYVKTEKYADQTFDLIYVYPDQTAEQDFTQWVLDRFDFNICKVAYHQTTGLEVDGDFWIDVLAKRLTLARGSRDWENHAERLKAKFPDYEFVDEREIALPGVQTTNGVGITK